MARYACQNGILAAVLHFSKRVGHCVRNSTVHSIKAAYLEKIKKLRMMGEETYLDALPIKKGRPPLLGERLDTMVQSYLRKVRNEGGAVTSHMVCTAAHGIIVTVDKTRLQEFGGHINLNRHWAHSFLTRMGFVQRRATTTKSKYSLQNFTEKKTEFLTDLASTVEMEEIPPQLIFNWDQTGIKLVPSTSWTMNKQGAKRVGLVGFSDKRQIAAVFCGNLLEAFLPIQLIYKGKTNRCHPSFNFPPGWDITHVPKHWSNEETMIQYVNNIFVPYVEQMRQLFNEDKPAVVIMDNFKGQITEAMTELLERHRIHTCLSPANATDRLQPMDISVNKPAKSFLKKKFEMWYSDQVTQQLEGQDMDIVDVEPIDLSMGMVKEIGAKWLVDMVNYIGDNPQFIVNGFIHAEIAKAF